MLTTQAPGGAEQTWRPPLRERVAETFALGIWLARGIRPAAGAQI